MNPDKKNNSTEEPNDSVADIVRQKIENIYQDEPDAASEEKEVGSIAKPSKHQKFMQELMNSGKNMEQIQNEWHQYYLKLNDQDKKEVWDEFYASNTHMPAVERKAAPAQQMSNLKHQVVTSKRFESKQTPTSHHKQIRRLDHKIKSQISANGQLKAKHYFQSLLFGLSMGVIVLVVFLFSFFNQVIIAPLIQPSRNASATPVIIGDGNLTATNVDQVIIPKINVEIPVNYAITTTNESVIENDLESGVIHYPDTVQPGQIGNAAYFGHSSNNIFNPGKYKFAFVLLHTMVKGDTFYLTFNHTIYIYKVISTAIVDPSDVGVLGPVPGQTATATLITCDPPGTSLHRLIVVGAQISPSVNGDTSPIATANASGVANSLPDNGPSLWSRLIGSNGGKSAVVVVGGAIVIIIFRRTNRRNDH